MDFQNFTVEEFATNESFQNWHLQVNEADIAFWEAWIKEHPEKLDEIEKAKVLINNLIVAEKETLPQEQIEQVVNNVQQHIKNSKQHKQIFFNPNQKLIWAAVAASLLLLIVLIGNNFNLKDETQPVQAQKIEYIERVVNRGQKLTVSLSDGSVIKLNSDTKFRFPKKFDSNKREVFLEGEAFFEVSRDTTRPFTVITGELKIEVLGTSFNVQNYDHNNAKVAVATGKVKVAAMDDLSENVILKPAEMVVFNKDSISLIKSDFNPKEELSWKDGVLFFNNNSVYEIFEKLERWYGVEFRITKGANLNRRYTGSFTNESLNNVLQAIKFSTNFNYKIENEEVIIY